MSKQKTKHKNRAATTKKNVAEKSIINRRNAIKLLIAVPVAGAAGAAIHRYDVQNRGLHDLTLIGQGNPVVVQIHDPACQLCRRLMNNTRKALKNNDNVIYRVADVTTSEGETFRQKHNVDNVTLLVFNAAGKKVDTIQGVTPIAELESRFVDIN